jgi:peptide/nickel transport system substrate-binding protein
MNIADQQAFASDEPIKRMVGTGPFKLVEWIPGDHITMAKPPNYWQSGRPYLDGLQILMLKDAQSTGVQLEGNSIDISDGLLIQDVVRLQKDPAYHVDSVDLGNVFTLEANMRNAPTNNKMVRQALQFAINRQRVVDTVLLGQGGVTAEGWPPSSIAYDPALANAYTFDLDKAKSLLQQSGVSNPSVELLYSSVSADYQTVLQIYQADLAKIGITATLKGTEQVAFIDQLFNSKFPGIAANASLFGQLHPAFFWGNAYYSPNANWASFKSDEYSKLADGLLKETDSAKQKQVYAQWTDYILDQSWAMPFSNTVPRTATTARVQGMTYNMTEFLMPNDAWLTS